jgi:hypothetical protein
VSMRTDSKKRHTASSITIDPNVRCLRIYPVEDKPNSKKTIADLKTVGLKLSGAQAIHLACVLLAAAQEWEESDLTAWRIYKRHSDGTYNLNRNRTNLRPGRLTALSGAVNEDQLL